jgi:alcohol dehydrogenase class IV
MSPHVADQPGSPAADLALRHALERQIAGLLPVEAGLQSAVAFPAVAPADWHGPASDAYASLEARMRSSIADAERTVAATLLTSRLALGDLGA